MTSKKYSSLEFLFAFDSMSYYIISLITITDNKNLLNMHLNLLFGP